MCRNEVVRYAMTDTVTAGPVLQDLKTLSAIMRKRVTIEKIF